MDPDTDPVDDLSSELDADELYLVFRKAIEDAMMNVVGTLVLVGIAFLFVLGGGYAFFTGPDPQGAVIGIAVILIGFYLAAVTLDIIPPVRERFWTMK